MSDRPLFIDIDGTLTMNPVVPWGAPRMDRIAKVKELILAGWQVVLWSGGGTSYARAFAEKYGLASTIAIGKPEMMIDDNPTIRPAGRMVRVAPDEFFAQCHGGALAGRRPA